MEASANLSSHLQIPVGRRRCGRSCSRPEPGVRGPGAAFLSETLPKVDVFHPGVDAAVVNVEKFDDIVAMLLGGGGGVEGWWGGGHMIRFSLVHLGEYYLGNASKGAFVRIYKIQKVTFHTTPSNQW